MKKERKITAPEGCEIEKVEIVDCVAVVTFKKKECKLPKSWEEFCEMFPEKKGEVLISDDSYIYAYTESEERFPDYDKNLLPDCATAEAVLALCQLIQLRNAYNSDWVPDWEGDSKIYLIKFEKNSISQSWTYSMVSSFLFFKSEELRDEFLRNFRPLIEKLKPLYGIKEGGDE